MLADTFTLPASKIVVSNRIAKASMSEAMADLRGRPTEALERLYRAWSAGGAGLLLTGNVQVDARYLERVGNVIVEDDAALAELSSWARAAREHGAHVFMQVSHPGRQVQRVVSGSPVAPSAVPAVKLLGTFARPRALEPAEIEDIVARFALVARVAERAGFSGVQIHGAHGYLVSQFLSPLTNRRTDAWGGSLEGRAKFLLDVVARVRAAVSPGFGVAVKLNSADFQRGGFEEGDALKVLAMLEGRGVDFVEISGGNYEAPALVGEGVAERTRAREAYFLDFAARARAATSLPIMLTGGFRSRAVMEEALTSGAVDLVGVARPLAFDPNLPKKLLAGEVDRATAPPVRARVRAFQPLAEVAWFAAQMQRIAAGLEPSATLSAEVAMARMLGSDFARSFARLVARLGRRGPAAALPAPGAT
ncbi:MAG: NADH:flavin oxidoreductase/NADH oxidase family protein [Myxococcales bacterium]|nr:NADH:flavin oxidoreductase/NADH oxidase family protein [Myxococcales bacterium]